MKLYSIPCIKEFNLELFKNDYVAKNAPVIIKGMAKSWKVCEKWNHEYLQSIIGDSKVSYKISSTNLFPDIKNASKQTITTASFSEYINLINDKKNSKGGNDKKWYFLSGDNTCLYNNGKFTDDYLNLKSDIEIPSFIKLSDLEKIGLWVSGGGVKSIIHYDSNGCHNVNAQLYGSKEVILIDPIGFDDLRMRSVGEDLSFFNFSNLIDFDIKDKKSLQGFKSSNLILLKGKLEEGDVLFLPSFWLHSFEHIGSMNININFWWHPEFIVINPTTVSWIICMATAQIISTNHPMLSEKHKQFLKKQTMGLSKDVDGGLIATAKLLSSTISKWPIGRPL